MVSAPAFLEINGRPAVFIRIIYDKIGDHDRRFCRSITGGREMRGSGSDGTVLEHENMQETRG